MTFANCKGLKKVIIPESVTTIGMGAFQRCSGLTSITLPNSLETIGDGAFQSCSGLTSIVIPNSVKTIGGSVFSFCSNLTDVTIGNSVTDIYDMAFYNCRALKRLYVSPMTPPVCSSQYVFFQPIYGSCTLYVDSGAFQRYKYADVWMNFSTIEVYDFSTSVESVESSTPADSLFNVYNLQGTLVKEAASKAEVYALPSGLYIVNGKKIMVK